MSTILLYLDTKLPISRTAALEEEEEEGEGAAVELSGAAGAAMWDSVGEEPGGAAVPVLGSTIAISRIDIAA